jgi:hypothetical protein
MASIRREILIESRSEEVWAAVRDFGAVHERLVPGFVVDCRLEGDTRILTFADGMVARELLVDIDEETRRLVYTVVQGRPTHFNGSVQIFVEDGDRSRLVWTVDILPNDLAGIIASRMEHGIAVIKQTLEGRLVAG